MLCTARRQTGHSAGVLLQTKAAQALQHVRCPHCNSKGMISSGKHKQPVNSSAPVRRSHLALHPCRLCTRRALSLQPEERPAFTLVTSHRPRWQDTGGCLPSAHLLQWG